MTAYFRYDCVAINKIILEILRESSCVSCPKHFPIFIILKSETRYFVGMADFCVVHCKFINIVAHIKM